MYSIIVLVFIASFINGCHSLSPPLSDTEISELGPYLRDQYLSKNITIQPHQTRVAFKHRFVDHQGTCHTSKPPGYYIAVDATTTVSDEALSKACEIVGRMTRHMATDVFNLVARVHGFGLFAKSEGPGIYPENHHLRDTPECHGTCNGSCAHTCTSDGRKFDLIFGITNIRSVVLDDNVLCNYHDPYFHKENIAVHELAHLVHRFMPIEDQNWVRYAYTYNKHQHTWYEGYGMSTYAEYWAEATEAFFYTNIRTSHSPAVGMNMCNFTHLCGSEQANREWLRTHDRMIYGLLVKIYTNNNPTIPSGLKVCQ